MEKFHPQVRYPEIRMAKRNHRRVAAERGPRGVGSVVVRMHVLIGPVLGVNDHHCFLRNLAVGFRFVNILPALVIGAEAISERNSRAPAVGLANPEQSRDFQVLCWSR